MGEVTSVPWIISRLRVPVGSTLQEGASSALASVSPFPEDWGERHDVLSEQDSTC